MKALVGVRFLLAICLPILSGTAIADERVLYKSVLPNGSVAYGDAPVEGSSSQPLRVEAHPADEEAAAGAQERLSRQRQATLDAFEQRIERLKDLDVLIAESEREVDAARANRVQAGEWREGDRIGIRLTGQYAHRVGQATRREDAAVARLAGLRQQRRALAP